MIAKIFPLKRVNSPLNSSPLKRCKVVLISIWFLCTITFFPLCQKAGFEAAHNFFFVCDPFQPRLISPANMVMSKMMVNPVRSPAFWIRKKMILEEH